MHEEELLGALHVSYPQVSIVREGFSYEAVSEDASSESS